MSLNNSDKTTIKAIWALVVKQSDTIGADAVGRMLTVYPQTKTYFSHWSDLGSKKVKEHGKVVMRGLALGVDSMDNMVAGLRDLSEKHAFQLRVDPNNYKLLSHCIHVVLAIRFPGEYTPEAHLAMDKLLCLIAVALSERYR